jgi:hypothetical protein
MNFSPQACDEFLMTVEHRIGASTDSQMLRPLEYAIMLFCVAILMLIILLHTQLYGSGITSPNSEPTPCQLKMTQ